MESSRFKKQKDDFNEKAHTSGSQKFKNEHEYIF